MESLKKNKGKIRKLLENGKIYCLLMFMTFIIESMRRTKIFFFILFFSSISVFAAPGGPGGPGGGGPSGGIGNPGSPGSRPGQERGPSPGAVPPPPAPNSRTGGTSEPSKNPPSQIMNYRGMRTVAVREPLKVLDTRILDSKNNKVQMEIKFNQSVNPLSIEKSSIILNDSPVTNAAKIAFNQKGDMLTLTLPAELVNKSEIESAKLKLLNVQTYDGKFVKELEIK